MVKNCDRGLENSRPRSQFSPYGPPSRQNTYIYIYIYITLYLKNYVSARNWRNKKIKKVTYSVALIITFLAGENENRQPEDLS